jgi:hypothetical protein
MVHADPDGGESVAGDDVVAAVRPSATASAGSLWRTITASPIVLSSSPPVVDAASDIARQNVAASSAASTSPCALVSAVLRLVASVEHGSEHPLATAIVRAARPRGHRDCPPGGCFRRARAPAEVSSVPH